MLTRVLILSSSYTYSHGSLRTDGCFAATRTRRSRVAFNIVAASRTSNGASSAHSMSTGRGSVETSVSNGAWLPSWKPNRRFLKFTNTSFFPYSTFAPWASLCVYVKNPPFEGYRQRFTQYVERPSAALAPAVTSSTFG